MKTLLTARVVREIHNLTTYEFDYMGEKVEVTKAGMTFNYNKEIPEKLMDFIEAWINEEV